MVPSSNLYFLEFVVNSLSLEHQHDEGDGSVEEDEHIRDTCVVLEFQGIRMEICAKDYGLPLTGFQSDRVKAGNSCLFVPRPGNGQLEMKISAFEKLDDDEKRLIGIATTDLSDIFTQMAKKYEGQMQGESQLRCSLMRGSASRALTSFRRSTMPTQPELPPVTSTVKRMHRLLGADGETKAVLEALLRFTCFGPSISTQFRVGSDTAKMLPLPFAIEDDGEDGESKCPFGCKSLLLPPYDEQPIKITNCDEILHRINQISSITAPPGSKTNVCDEAPYTEYTAEMNGNALVIRVPKGANLATRAVSDEQLANGKTPQTQPLCWCTDHGVQNPYQPYAKNSCNLPPIRGNLKYPTIDACKTASVLNNQRNVCLQCDATRQIPSDTNDPALAVNAKDKAGIEICRKGWHDRHTDVFVLKLGKRSGDANKHAIELELRTPKNPDSMETVKATKQVQANEDEFDDLSSSKVDAKKPAGKGGKKAGKGKDKKAKKK